MQMFCKCVAFATSSMLAISFWQNHWCVNQLAYPPWRPLIRIKFFFFCTWTSPMMDVNYLPTLYEMSWLETFTEATSYFIVSKHYNKMDFKTYQNSFPVTTRVETFQPMQLIWLVQLCRIRICPLLRECAVRFKFFFWKIHPTRQISIERPSKG